MKRPNKTILPNIDSLWNFDRPQESEAKFRQILSEVEVSGNDGYYAELLTQLARTQSLQRKFDEAHNILDKAEKVIDPLKLPVAHIRYLLERGRTYNSSKEKEKAINHFRQAFDLAVSNNADYYAIDSAHMLGIAETQENQLYWNLKALELAENSTDPGSKKWLGSLYNNIGWTYHDLKDYQKALELFENYLDFSRKQNDEMGSFIAKWCIGRTLRSLHQIDRALEIQFELLKIKEEKGSDPDAYVYEELAECLFLKGETPAAKKYFHLAYDILSKDTWLKANEPNRLKRLKNLGE